MILMGINDMFTRLARDTYYDPHFLEKRGWEDKLSLEAFSVLPVGRNLALPYYKRAAIWHLGRKMKYRVFSPGQIQDKEGKYMINWREHRRNAVAIRDTLPDLSLALEEYSRNINTIIDMTRDASVRLILLTQPTLWKPDLSERLKNLLAAGGIGAFRQNREREYYSVEALAAGIRMYNETMLRVSRMRQVECLDLASCLSEDTTVFYDDCHFNESGAEKFAEILARYMLQHGPFE